MKNIINILKFETKKNMNLSRFILIIIFAVGIIASIIYSFNGIEKLENENIQTYNIDNLEYYMNYHKTQMEYQKSLGNSNIKRYQNLYYKYKFCYENHKNELAYYNIFYKNSNDISFKFIYVMFNFMIYSSYILLFYAIILPLIDINLDFKHKNIKNILTFGVTRNQIYNGKLFLCIIKFSILFLIVLLIGILLGSKNMNKQMLMYTNKEAYAINCISVYCSIMFLLFVCSLFLMLLTNFFAFYTNTIIGAFLTLGIIGLNALIYYLLYREARIDYISLVNYIPIINVMDTIHISYSWKTYTYWLIYIGYIVSLVPLYGLIKLKIKKIQV